jgi:hypothetical protein
MHIKGSTREEVLEAVKQKKLSTSLEELCDGQPEEILKYMQYCRGL